MVFDNQRYWSGLETTSTPGHPDLWGFSDFHFRSSGSSSRSSSTGDHRDRRLQAPAAVTQSSDKTTRKETSGPQPSAARREKLKTCLPQVERREIDANARNGRKFNRISIRQRSRALTSSGCLGLKAWRLCDGGPSATLSMRSGDEISQSCESLRAGRPSNG